MFSIWNFLQFLVFYNILAVCKIINDFSEENSLNENASEENLVLDSVYDTMKHNYEVKLRQNLEKLNVLSDIRNKRNVNEPMNMDSFYKNHQFEIVNRKSPETFPLGFKNPPKLSPLTTNVNSMRSDYYDEDMG